MPVTIVSRYPGDKPGDNIVSSVLTTVEAQEERGRGEVNYSAHDQVLESGNLIGTSFIRPGRIVSVIRTESSTKEKVTSFSLNVRNEGFSITSAIQTERTK